MQYAASKIRQIPPSVFTEMKYLIAIAAVLLYHQALGRKNESVTLPPSNSTLVENTHSCNAIVIIMTFWCEALKRVALSELPVMLIHQCMNIV